ncbi:MAG: ComF family protein [candidate division WOR-3 bacterium]
MQGIKLITRFLSELKNFVLDLLLPPKCLGCGKELTHGHICDRCFYSVTTGALGVCPLCGYPKAFEDKCYHPLKTCPCGDSGLIRIRALGKYNIPFKNLLHRFKYQEYTKVGKLLGLGLANLIGSDPVLSRADFIVPIPLHPARRRERGFNQAEILAKEACLNTGIEFLNCLSRKKNTKSQTILNHKARLENVIGAFSIKEDFLIKIKDRRIILVDDVITTGATLQEAARILTIAQAVEVYAVVVAVAA